MKISKSPYYTHYFLTAFLCLIILVNLSSCEQKLSFSTSAIVPAAEGSVKYKKDKNDNYAVDLTVTNLSPADRLIESRNTYVVWVNTDGNGIKNLGQLKSSSGVFSKTLKSSLNTTTPFKPLSFFITAENASDITYPDGQVVLKTK